jgi:hypothetical protein
MKADYATGITKKDLIRKFQPTHSRLIFHFWKAGYMVKKFLNNDLISLKEKILGLTLQDIYFQRCFGLLNNLFVLNFGRKNAEFTIHCSCFLRFVNNEKVLMTYNDLFLDKKGHEMSIKKYRSQETYEESLLSTNISFLIEALLGSFVSDVIGTNFGDLKIVFSNGIACEIINDTHEEKFELYRFFDLNDEKAIHFVISNQGNRIIFETIEKTDGPNLSLEERKILENFLDLSIPPKIKEKNIFLFDNEYSKTHLSIVANALLKFNRFVFEFQAHDLFNNKTKRNISTFLDENKDDKNHGIYLNYFEMYSKVFDILNKQYSSREIK